mgnify:FL=1|tara:strand:- start:627 stop:1139 length:513 start_codon:yes stop_codon:yes gene_type:complete
MHRLIIIIIIFSTIGHARELTYAEFTSGNSFSPIDESYLELKAKCRKSYDQRNQKKYYEVLLYSRGEHVFDLNKHFKSKLVGRKSLKTPFYSLSLWNWFDTLAIKTKKHKFMTNTDQRTMRRNELISEGLFSDIVKYGKFKVYFHYLLDNSKSVGNFKITNLEVVRDCVN